MIKEEKKKKGRNSAISELIDLDYLWLHTIKYIAASKYYYSYTTHGSGALPSKVLDLGLLKINLGVFFIIGALTLQGTNLIPFLTLLGKANLYLT